MSAFNSAVRVRALNMARKLSADQRKALDIAISQKATALTIEKAYEGYTNNLLEPIIARYWIHAGRVCVWKVNY